MPQAAFVVKLDLQEATPGSLSSTAEQIQEALEINGMTIISVNPWDRAEQIPAITQSGMLSGQPFQPPA